MGCLQHSPAFLQGLAGSLTHFPEFGVKQDHFGCLQGVVVVWGHILGCTGILHISPLFACEENTELPGMISLGSPQAPRGCQPCLGPWTWGAVQSRKMPPSPALPSHHCPCPQCHINGLLHPSSHGDCTPSPGIPLRDKTFPDLQPKPPLHSLRPSALVPREKRMRSSSRIWKTPPPSLHYSSQKSRFTQSVNPAQSREASCSFLPPLRLCSGHSLAAEPAPRLHPQAVVQARVKHQL